MSKRKKSSNLIKSDVAEIQQHQKQVVVSTSVSNLTDIVSEIAVDVEKVDIYISAIQKLTNNRHTPYDEVNEINVILERVQQQSENLKRRYSDLLLFLSETKQELSLQSEVVKQGDSNE